VEVDDLFAAVRQIVKAQPGIDPARIGFFGWSYGGTLATRAILDVDSPFAAAVAVAPVTDWTLYDTAYTERYLGLPTLADGSVSPFYRDADLTRRAGLLTKPYLLMHGTADDNVLFEHSLRLIAALEAQDRVFDLAIYPGKAHGIGGRASQIHVYETIDAFFARTLRPGGLAR
jgi:dipeptidyl-peptidase-4